jgi:hypothetical protein
MDEEELYRGTFKAKDGTFKGRPPAKVPRDFAMELAREFMLRSDSEFKQDFLKAIRHLRFLAFNADRDDVQLKAVLAWIERVMGKTPEKVIVSPGKPEWESAVDNFLDTIEPEQISHANTILRRTAPPEPEGSRTWQTKPYRGDFIDAEVVEDEQLMWEILDEELASEIADGSSEAAG